MESQELDPDRSARLSGARAEFIASLGRRLEALRAALAGLEQEPRSKSRRDNLLRRVHAMGAAARVLGFAAVAEALGTAELALQRSARAREVAVGDLAEVSLALDQLPSLVWGIASTAPAAPSAVRSGEDRRWPLSVLVFGSTALAEGLSEGGASAAPIETERTEELERARDLARIMGPDIVVLDADRRGARELAEAVLVDPLMEPAPLIVVGTFNTPDSAANLVALGAARVLPKPVSPDTLRRSVLEVTELLAPRRGIREPLGEITVEGLADRIATEVRRGLIEAVEPLGRQTKIGLGEGTDVLGAVWASVARVRELVTLRSGGTVRFDAAGPEGAIPMAPWSGGERGAGERGGRDTRDPAGVSLEGRTALVADDDPAVVWFIGGLLRAVGTQSVEAHDGRRALELAFETWPDLVVSDLLMPGLDGFSLCREIKRDVAIRDVPVIVLSWKEDLLQRMRDLGADADGYLRKEASASTVVQRVREVLRPRARVEARLRAGGEVRGRLDGLTPRLVLQLACALRPDARVSIRDAVYLYEVQIREGRPVCATRTAADGGFERGEGVLGALLGASAGRFAVTPDRSNCRRDFDGSLAQVLKGPIARARTAQHALSADRFMRVERVEIDETAILAYVASTPEPARSLVQKLLQGAAPRELVVSGEVSPRLLDLVLGDVARHGAVLAVEGADGVDLLQRSAAALAPPSAPEPVVPPPTPAPEPQFTMQLSPGPAEVSDISAAVAAPVVMTFGAPLTPAPPRDDVPEVAAFAPMVSPMAPPTLGKLETPGLPLSRNVTPFAATLEPEAVLGASWSSGEPTTLPGVGAAAPIAPDEPEAPAELPPPAPTPEEPPPPEPTSAEPEGSMPAAIEEPGSPPPPSREEAAPPKVESEDAFAATLNITREEIRSSPPPRFARSTSRPSAPTLDAVRSGGVDLDHAVLEALEGSWGPPDAESKPAPPAVEGTPKPLPTLPKSEPPPPADDPDVVEAAAASLLAQVSEPKARLRSGGTLVLEPQPTGGDVDPAAEASEPPARTITKTVRIETPPPLPVKEKATTDETEASDPAFVAELVGTPVKELRSAEGRAQSGERPVEPRVRSVPPPLPSVSPPVPESKPIREEARAQTGKRTSKPPEAKPRAKPAEAPRPGEAARGRPAESNGSSGIRVVLLAIAAAAASYGLVSWAVSTKAPGGDPPAAGSTPVAFPSAAPAVPVPAAVASSAAPRASAVVEELALPAGVPVSEGKGLLEVDTGGKQSIYVDSVFVGRGPLRRVPLDPGRHDVMLRLDADELVQVVEVRAGKRTRLSLAAPP